MNRPAWAGVNIFPAGIAFQYTYILKAIHTPKAYKSHVHRTHTSPISDIYRFFFSLFIKWYSKTLSKEKHFFFFFRIYTK